MRTFKNLLTVSAITLIHFSVLAQQWSGNNNTNDIINRDGKVGLGTATPVGRLEVFGDVITQVELGSVGPFALGSRWNSIGDRVNNPPTGARFTGFRTQWDFNAVNLGLRERVTGGIRDAVISWQDGSSEQNNPNRLIFAFRNNQIPTSGNPNLGFFECMTLLNNGKLGLGTSNPFLKFTTSSGEQNDGINIIQTGSTGSQIFMQNIPSGRGWGIYTAGALNGNLGNAGNFAIFNPFFSPTGGFGSSAFVINTNNNFIGIGTNSPTTLLTVNGVITSTGISIPSDNRLKTDIKTLSNGIELIKRINIYTYKYKQDVFKSAKEDSLGNKEKYNFPENKQYGVIAQELKEILPDAVTKDNEGYYNVNYITLIPVLVQSIKDQQKDIENLRSQIAISNAQSKLNQNSTTLIAGSITNISPNPTTNNINVSYEIKQNIISCNIIIFDSNGNTFSNNNCNIAIGLNTQNINVSNLASGNYYVGLVINGQIVESKIINKL